MVDLVGPIIDFAKLVGGPIVRYLKRQIKFNGNLKKFNESKEGLSSLKHEIELRQQTQLQSALYHVGKPEVEIWLKGVEEFLRQDIENEMNSRGCLSCCRRTVILEERTQELEQIRDRGNRYTNECLIIEDHSKKVDYEVKRFKQLKEKLQCQSEDIASELRSQLGYDKSEKKEVRLWREKVDKGGYLSLAPDPTAVPLGEKIRDMETICEERSQLPDCLVIDDYSKKVDCEVNRFNQLKEKLQCQSEDIASELRSQLGYGKSEKKGVRLWLEKVDEGGYLSLAPDPTAVPLGEKIREMETICEEGSRLPDRLVTDDPLASAVELQVSKLRGNEAVKANILACLKGKEVTMLGVWGMGGVGKTTIMMHVHNELLKEGKFKKVIWVTVSQNFDIYNLQEKIASNLGEKLQEHQDRVNRAAKLSKILEEQKPFLLLLDDVWSSFKLEDVGIPKPNETDGCKLVLTTRSQEVARSMDCRSSIQVKTLSEDEALKLFSNEVGDTALSCQGGGIKKDLEPTLKKIVAECDGLPLALITVAGSLKGISESESWCVALDELRDCKRNVAGTDDDDAFRILKFSYDRLKNKKIQDCFLYCALYPEDYKISKEEIIESWIDEGFIDEMESRKSMKNKGYDILRKLVDNSLLEFIEDYFRGHGVRMHDLIRDMALHITKVSPRFLVEAGKSLTKLPKKVKCTEDVEKVSVMFNQIEDIPSSMASSTCTRLTTLLLARNKLSTIPESVFEHMLELKILNLSFNRMLSSLPNSVSKLVKLTTLLLESTSLEKVPSLSGLGSLKKLNLRGTKIKEVPEGLGMLKNLECLFLCGSRREGYHPEIDEIADGVLSKLSELQELIVDKSRIKLKGDVVGRLMKLEVFHGWFPSTNEMRFFLQCQPNRLSSYFINVGSNLEPEEPEESEDSEAVYDAIEGSEAVYDAIEESPRYKKIMVFNKTSIIGENMLLPSVQLLFIEACHDIRSLNDFSAIKDATDLKRCLIWDCGGMECVFSSWINNPVVQTLEELSLGGLRKLDGLFEANVMVMSSPPAGTFSSLVVVEIMDCKKIKKLFPSWKLVEYLQSLESIVVRHCKKMEEIIGSDPEEGEEGEDIIKKRILPKLEGLTLSQLPALKSICSRRVVMVCDFLESIYIDDCKGLRRIPLCPSSRLSLDGLVNLDWVFEVELIAMSPPQPCTFSSLYFIKIKKCIRVKKLFPSWKLVEYLQSLGRIEVEDCEEMEEIIGSDPEEEGEGGDIIKKLILPKLKFLRLDRLPTLKIICSRRAVMVCDSLEEIRIYDCKGLRRIPFCLPPRLDLSDCLDWVFEVELIAMSPPQPHFFSFLKEVSIWNCKKMKKLFPFWKLVEYLNSLEEISVGKCEEMEEIIALDPKEEGEEGGDIIKKLILSKLRQLTLSHLPALKSICSRRVVMECNSLEKIKIKDCKGLRRIPFRLPPCLDLYELDCLDWVFEVELIAMSPPKQVEIWGCERIKKLFPSWKFLKYLQSLESIRVWGCEEMEEIIGSDLEEEGEGGDIIKELVLPKLKELKLEHLPALKSICSRRAVMVCDSLESITIYGCKGLRRFPLSPPPSLKKINVYQREEEWWEWWESLEWDHTNAKDVLRPMVHFC